MGKLALCLDEGDGRLLEAREFVLVPPYEPLRVGSGEIPIPVGATVWMSPRIEVSHSNIVPREEEWIVQRGDTQVRVDRTGILRVEVEPADENSFGPLIESFQALPDSEFPELVRQLDELDKQGRPLPIEPAVTRVLLSEQLVTLPEGASIEVQGCETGYQGCTDGIITINRGDSAVVFETDGYRIVYEYVNGNEPDFEKLIDTIRTAGDSTNPA
jgi:hypothetical protein